MKEKTVGQRIPTDAMEQLMAHIDPKKIKICGWIGEAIIEKIEREKYFKLTIDVNSPTNIRRFGKHGPTEFKGL